LSHASVAATEVTHRAEPASADSRAVFAPSARQRSLTAQAVRRLTGKLEFLSPRAREQQILPDVQNGARITIQRPETACHLLTTRGPSCTTDCGSSKIEEGLQAHCKNQPSVHGQLAGISKLNPRRLGTRFYKSEVRSDLASAERAGSAGKHCSSRARGDKNSRSSKPPPLEHNTWGAPHPKAAVAGPPARIADSTLLRYSASHPERLFLPLTRPSR
jgi:hypothetical protein